MLLRSGVWWACCGLLCLGVISVLTTCSFRQNSKTYSDDIERPYLNGQWAKAYSRIAPKLERARPKDKLILLLQAGTILHTMQEWQKSAELFEEALALSDTYTKSASENFRAFFLNDSVKRYVPENFERILIFYYLASNYIMDADLKRAYQYFKRMSDELALIRDFDANYKENYVVRYLYALVAEALDRNEEARVQYNNILATSTDATLKKAAQAGLYALAIKENDVLDIERYQAHGEDIVIYQNPYPDLTSLPSPLLNEEIDPLAAAIFNTNVNTDTGADIDTDVDADIDTDISTDVDADVDIAVDTDIDAEVDVNMDADIGTDVKVAAELSLKDDYAQLGSVVIFHESGLAPYKVSRGKIAGDREFEFALKGAIGIALLKRDFNVLSYGQLFFWVTSAENPVPVFKRRETNPSPQSMVITINDDKKVMPLLRTSYSDVVIQNFNEQYPRYVNRHALSAVTKVATVIVTSAVTASQINKNNKSGLGDIAGFFINLLGGALINKTLKPDLRSWTLAYDTLQVYRVFFLPGTYQLAFEKKQGGSGERTFSALSHYEVVVKPGETTFVHAYSY
ncbi:hypothetical protein COTS27_00436 [Spirochaetota bacterium]|nr:hypothetical protein COTS27_00436 [Spirochaetota bacterium]